MFNLIRPAVVLFLALTVVTGIVYPALVTVIAQVAFADRAGGSILVRDGKKVGSELIAQPFTDAKYFWPRPSAANYDATAATGSNLGPTNPALIDAVKGRIATLQVGGPTVPVDLVTTSASGLDPHISVAAARYQVARVAKARGLSVAAVGAEVDALTERPTFGILGEERVNVLKLNLTLDRPQVAHSSTLESTFGVRAHGFLPTAN